MKAFIVVVGVVCLVLGIDSMRAESRSSLKTPGSPGHTSVAQPKAVRDNSSSFHGTFGDKIIPLKTEFGVVRVATRVIKRISPVGDGRRILLRLKNRDEITGVPERPEFSVVTKKGEVKIPFYGSGNLGVYVFGTKAGGIDVYPVKHTPLGSLAKDLVIHFSFDGSDHRKILNQTKSTDPATLVHGRHKNGMISLDGRGDHLLLSNHRSFEELNSFSLSIWVNLNNYAPRGYANEHGYLVNKGKDLWWNPAWCLGYGKKSGVALFTIGTEKSQGRAKCRVTSRTKLAPGKWYHLAGTYDGNHASIYVNGRLERRIPYRGKIRRDKAPLILGGGNLRNTSFGNHFTTNAHIDDFRLYNRALTPGEINRLHQCAPPHRTDSQAN